MSLSIRHKHSESEHFSSSLKPPSQTPLRTVRERDLTDLPQIGEQDVHVCQAEYTQSVGGLGVDVKPAKKKLINKETNTNND